MRADNFDDDVPASYSLESEEVSVAATTAAHRAWVEMAPVDALERWWSWLTCFYFLLNFIFVKASKIMQGTTALNHIGHTCNSEYQLSVLNSYIMETKFVR
jgi:hypothetical protein